MTLLDARIVAPGERRLGELVGGADYSVRLDPAQVEVVEERLPQLLAEDELWVERIDKKRAKKGRRGRRKAHSESPPTKRVNVRPFLVDASLDARAGRLSFRLGRDENGASARPREIIQLLVGEPVADHLFCRERLLASVDDTPLTSLRGLGAVWRSAERRVGEGAPA
jgi:hypothetical protein